MDSCFTTVCECGGPKAPADARCEACQEFFDAAASDAAEAAAHAAALAYLKALHSFEGAKHRLLEASHALKSALKADEGFGFEGLPYVCEGLMLDWGDESLGKVPFTVRNVTTIRTEAPKGGP